LFLLTFLVSLGMSWFATRMQRARQQKAAVEEIERLGGDVEYDYAVDQSGNPISGAVPPGPAWLRNLLGNDFFATVVEANFLSSSSVTDASLGHLKRLTQLQRLFLCRTKVTDAGLEHLNGLTKLRELKLSDTKVADEGVKRLQQALPNCEINHATYKQDVWTCAPARL
jgi:hypothetical protein